MADRRDIDRLLEDMERQPGLPSGAVRDFREAIDTSPYLASVMIKAIELGTLRRLEVSESPNESGHYEQSTGTVSISTTILNEKKASLRLDMLAGTLGHETGHALMGVAARNSLNTFLGGLSEDIKQGAQYGDPVVDVTEHAKQYVVAARQNEGLAELVSMNAVASRVIHTEQEWSEARLLSRLERTTACVMDGKLEPGIQLDSHGMQDPGVVSPAQRSRRYRLVISTRVAAVWG